MVKEVSDADFKKEVLESAGHTLVDFWAPWCGPCRYLTPIIEEVSNTMSEELKVVKVNIDQNVETPSQFNVRSIPTLVLFKDGKQVAIKVGGSSKEDLIQWLNQHKS